MVVLDHYSRRIMGFGIFRKEPKSVEVRNCLGQAMAAMGTSPRHLISDKGSQFWPCSGYKRWCRQHKIRPRFGAIGKHGSIAVIERAQRSLKEALRWTFIPTRRNNMHTEMTILLGWYNQHRPHMALAGKTPDEVYFDKFPNKRRPRMEPRPGWPRGSPCARPQALVAGKPGARFDIEVEHVGGHAHLPIVRLCRAA